MAGIATPTTTSRRPSGGTTWWSSPSTGPSPSPSGRTWRGRTSQRCSSTTSPPSPSSPSHGPAISPGWWKLSNCFSYINIMIVVFSDWKEKKTFCLLKSYFSPFVCGNNLNCEFYHFCLFCWMFVMKRNVTLSATTGSHVPGVALWSCWLTTALIFSWSWPSCSTTPSSTRFVTESSESSSWSGPSRGSESSRHGYFIGKTKSAAVLMKY